MIVEVIKGAVGTEYWVRVRMPGDRQWHYLKSFDDIVKATAYKERVINGEAEWS